MSAKFEQMISSINLKSHELRPTLKSCSIPIHRLGEMKNSHELPVGRDFFFLKSLLSKKIYDKKI